MNKKQGDRRFMRQTFHARDVYNDRRIGQHTRYSQVTRCLRTTNLVSFSRKLLTNREELHHINEVCNGVGDPDDLMNSYFVSAMTYC